MTDKPHDNDVKITPVDVMIDLETYGLECGSIIVSIGAVPFNFHQGSLEDVLGAVHCRLSTVEQFAVGLKADPETVEWWLGMPKEAQDSLLQMEAVEPRQALVNLSEWLEEIQGVPQDELPLKHVRVWGNGCNFDPPLLRELYKAMALKCPWAWYNEMCYRTERRQQERLIRRLGMEEPAVPRFGVKHSALDDARYQVQVLKAYNQALSNKLDLTQDD